MILFDFMPVPSLHQPKNNNVSGSAGWLSVNNAAIAILTVLFFTASSCLVKNTPSTGDSMKAQIQLELKEKILKDAAWALRQGPETVTASFSPRSAGTINDFYSEGDYWWPDPKNPKGPYIQKDGLSNPDNFTAHRLSMIRFGTIIGALASAYKITKDEKYVRHAMIHLNAWFINKTTMMNPSLTYAQAIKGISKGRGIGIIDTIHLIEVAQGTLLLKDSKSMDKETYSGTVNWFASYISWLKSSKNGQDERAAKNNHGVCWVMQVASFAKLCEDEKTLEECRERYKNVLLPDQMANNGSFPLEIARTKPYGYSIFNLDAMAVICQILSTRNDNLWQYFTHDGKSIKKGIEYLYPFVKNKDSWPFKKDVMYWDNWPVAQPFLVLGANAYANKAWLDTWKGLDQSPTIPEVVRNLPLRHPIIWL